jgi:HEAT repeat protein
MKAGLSFELIVFAFANVAALAAYLFRRYLQRMSRDQEAWFTAGLQAASEQLGVHFSPRAPRSWDAKGSRDPLAVTVALSVEIVPDTLEEPSERVEFLKATVSGGLIPRGMSFTLERDLGDDVLVGDPLFDDTVEARGEPRVVLARLDEDVRKKVRRLVSDGGRLEDGVLVWHAPVRYLSPEIPHALRTLLDLAADLSATEGGGICPRLARNATRDSVSGVRLWNLLALQEQFPRSREAEEASRHALGDPSPWVRLSAARFVWGGEEAVLEALVLDLDVPDEAAGDAVALLAARRPAAEAGPILVSALKTRSGEARLRAVQELGRIRFAPAFGPLVVLLERSDAGTAAAAAQALARLGDARAEPSLLARLGSDARELRLAAARALGVVGGVAAVEPLLRRLDTGGLDAESRQVVREAVAAIQSRLAGAEAAQLSLVEDTPERGRLTLAAPGPGPGDLSPVAEGAASPRSTGLPE